MEENVFDKGKGRSDLLSSIILKIIAAVLMTIDHIAFFFVNSSSHPTLYYVLRAIGKISFPVFAFLAFRGVYQTKNIKNYILRLAFPAIIMDIISYLIGYVGGLSVAENYMIGNAFTDLAIGVITVYLLKRKDMFSFLALIPIGISFLFEVEISESYGTLLKSDWGLFSTCLFVSFFAFHELANLLLRYKARTDGFDENLYVDSSPFIYEKAAMATAVLFTELVFYLIYRIDNFSFLLPNEFVPIGTYSTLAVIPILLSSEKKGYSSKLIQYSFYIYYPAHVIILGIIALGLGYF